MKTTGRSRRGEHRRASPDPDRSAAASVAVAAEVVARGKREPPAAAVEVAEDRTVDRDREENLWGGGEEKSG